MPRPELPRRSPEKSPNTGGSGRFADRLANMFQNIKNSLEPRSKREKKPKKNEPSSMPPERKNTSGPDRSGDIDLLPPLPVIGQTPSPSSSTSSQRTTPKRSTPPGMFYTSDGRLTDGKGLELRDAGAANR